jgi:hypothetical protein
VSPTHFSRINATCLVPYHRSLQVQIATRYTVSNGGGLDPPCRPYPATRDCFLSNCYPQQQCSARCHLLVFSMDRSGKQRQYGDGDGDGALFLSWNCGRSQHHPFNSPIYLSELVRVTISIWIKLTCFVCELECDKYIYEHMLLALLSR